MKAIRIHQYGGPEVLAQVEMQRPTPGPNDVLIKVHAASVNAFDRKARAGFFCVGFLFDVGLLRLPRPAGTVGGFDGREFPCGKKHREA